jgi:homoserine kinase
MSHIAAFVAGCYRGDVDLIGRSLRDFIVEPYRAELVPGFSSVKRAAMKAGALGCSLSGAGPACFAWARAGDADDVRTAMLNAFGDEDVPAEAWVVKTQTPGARLV